MEGAGGAPNWVVRQKQDRPEQWGGGGEGLLPTQPPGERKGGCGNAGERGGGSMGLAAKPMMSDLCRTEDPWFELEKDGQNEALWVRLT